MSFDFFDLAVLLSVGAGAKVEVGVGGIMGSGMDTGVGASVGF